VIFQVVDNARPELADIGLDFADIFPEGIQLGDQNSVTVGPSILPAGDYGPRHDDDQDSDGSDYLSQSGKVFHQPEAAMTSWAGSVL